MKKSIIFTIAIVLVLTVAVGGFAVAKKKSCFGGAGGSCSTIDSE